jgi:two-component system sensor histidine kinase/response regulator
MSVGRATLKWVDEDMVASVSGGRPGAIRRLGQVFLRAIPVQLEQARSSLRAGDARELAEAAHTLAGTLSAFSTAAGEHARRLEDTADAGDLAGCAPLVAELEAIASELLEEVRALAERS